MVFILGAGNDQSTNDVIDWLMRMDTPFLRINAEDKIIIHTAEPTNTPVLWDFVFSINQGSTRYRLSRFTAFWYRKGFLQIDTGYPHTRSADSLEQKVAHFVLAETQAVTDLFIHTLELKRTLGNFFQSLPNKPLVLAIAREKGLDVPRTLITTSKQALMSFKDSEGEVICKSIQDVFGAQDENHSYYTRTELVTDAFIADLPDTFPLSLVQEKLEKQYEIRSYFFKRTFYSIAIFSQNNDKTRVDFRNYDFATPNRFVPFQLPADVEKNLIALLDHFGFNTASVDLVYTDNGKFVFLEINPNGQFGMVSKNGGYELEQKIAEYLAHE